MSEPYIDMLKKLAKKHGYLVVVSDDPNRKDEDVPHRSGKLYHLLKQSPNMPPDHYDYVGLHPRTDISALAQKLIKNIAD